jgi:hypothetical protein
MKETVKIISYLVAALVVFALLETLMRRRSRSACRRCCRSLTAEVMGLLTAGAACAMPEP